MGIPEICISFIVALIGIAYPLMLQVISRLEDKYSSMHILTLIKEEKTWNVFRKSLVGSMVIVFLYVVLNYPLFELNAKLFTICLHLISILLIIGTLVTVTSFVLFTKNVFVYDSITELIKYLINKDKELYQKDDVYLLAIADVLYTGIRQNNMTIIEHIQNYLYEVFQRYRDNCTNLEIEYPNLYYDIVYRSIVELAILKENKIPSLEHIMVSGQYFIGDSEKFSIHETTYSWIWNNLLAAIEHDREDYIMLYWERAHQYITYNLQFIGEDVDYSSGEIRNKEAVERRKKERERFMEFHFALGGLLLYTNRYDVIGRVFRYTTSMPPTYELLPNTMDEIFKQYFKFQSHFGHDFLTILKRYSFPNLEGIYREDIIKNWICKYLTLLFLRQYSIVPYLIIMKPLDYPAIPESQAEKKNWIENLKYFKMRVAEHLVNTKLLQSVRLDFLTDERIKEIKHTPPLKYIDELQAEVEVDFTKTEIEQPISEKKRDEYFKFSSDYITKTFDSTKFINNQGEVNKDFSDKDFCGTYSIIDKSLFAEHQPAENQDYHQFLAESLSEVYFNEISIMFHVHTRKRYLFKAEDLFQAIDKLNLSPDKHIIIAFGINLLEHADFSQIKGLNSDGYNGIRICLIRNCNHLLVGQTLFIVRKDCLPVIDYSDTQQSDIEKYSLKKLNEEYKIYASVIDLYRNENLRRECSASKTEDELLKSVLMKICVNLRFRWRNEMNMIAFKLYSKYGKQGLINKVDEITPFD